MTPDQIFSPNEIDKIGKSLWIALGDNPALPHWEFPILTGISINDALIIVKLWPNVDLKDKVTWRTIWGILGNLKGYPHKQEQRLLIEAGLRRCDLKELMEKIRNFDPDHLKFSL